MPLPHPKRLMTISAPRSRSATGHAVPILAQPFPAPGVITVTCQKPESGKIGVNFRWGGARGDRVEIMFIAESSPLFNTEIQVGQTLLAVNDVAAVSSKQIAKVIRDSGPELVLTTCCCAGPALAPFCKLIAAPSRKSTPGVNFDSTRGRCLVQVSRVFRKGPFSGTDLNIGDIVLAINGTSVSKVEEADEALRQASTTTPYTLLYVVDMMAYRYSVVEEMRTSPAFQQVGLVPGRESYMNSKEAFLVSKEEVFTKLEFDFESQHLVDKEGHLRLANFSKEHSRELLFGRSPKCFHRGYRVVVVPFMNAFNDGIERRMRLLEEVVCCDAWKTRWEADAWKTRWESRSDVPRLRGDSIDSSAESRSDVSAISHYEDEDIPLATAEVEVLPLGVLQSVQERISVARAS